MTEDFETSWQGRAQNMLGRCSGLKLKYNEYSQSVPMVDGGRDHWKTVEELLVDTNRLANRWTRSNSEASDAAARSGKMMASVKKLPTGTRKRRIRIAKVMRELQRELRREAAWQERIVKRRILLPRSNKRRSK